MSHLPPFGNEAQSFFNTIHMLKSETHCWSKSLERVIYAIYHHLEVKHISFEQNSQVKVRNILLVEKLA